MHWFNALTKAVADYLGAPENQMVLIVIVITATITTVLGYAIPAFGRFLFRLPSCFRRGWPMVRAWLFWRRFHPDCTFTNRQPAVISKIATASDNLNKDSGYRIILEMRLCVHNRHDIDSLFLDCAQGQMHLIMHSERRAKYSLFFKSSDAQYKIPALHDKTIDFTLVTLSTIDIKPKLGCMAHCAEINIGMAKLSGMCRKIKGKPFDVKVDWPQVEDDELGL